MITQCTQNLIIENPKHSTQYTVAVKATTSSKSDDIARVATFAHLSGRDTT